jgi:sporulation related protein
MVKTRGSDSRNWARGALAFFWIVLAGFSGVYLFTLLTDPTAFGGQVTRLNPSEAPAGSELASSSLDADEVSKMKSTLRELSQQMAEINTRLKPIEKAVGPVASLSPSNTETTTTSQPEPVVPPSPPAAASPPPSAAPASQTVKPSEKPAEAAKPAEAPKPAQTAALEPKPAEKRSTPEVKPPAPSASSAPAAEEPADEGENYVEPTPPPVTVSEPDEDVPEESSSPSLSSNLSAPTPPKSPSPPSPTVGTESVKPAGSTESAMLDPTALPPAANDGTTRYGIEIGVVAKQDGLRPLWREFLTNHAALVAGLQPRRVLAPDKKWRLIAGPFSNAAEAAQACALFKKASRPCEATVFAGDSL